MDWKQKLTQARELKGKAGGLAFDRITLLVEVYGDPEFRAGIGRSGPADDFEAQEFMDADEMDGLNLDFLEAQQLLAH